MKYKLTKNSIVVFLIFLFILIKYIIFNHLELFHPYGRLNKLISFYLIFPLLILGVGLTLMVIIKFLTNKEKNVINLILTFPFILFIILVMF